MAVLLGLAVLWAIVLLPDVIRRAGSRRSHDSIGMFKSHLSVLERANPVQSPLTGTGRPSNVVQLVPRSSAPRGSLGTGPVAPLVPAGRSSSPAAARSTVARPATGRPAGAPARMTVAQAHRRRQDVMTALVAASLLSFLAAMSFGGAFFAVHVAFDVLLLAFLGLTLVATRRQIARSKVSYLPRSVSGPTLAHAHAPRRSSAAR